MSNPVGVYTGSGMPNVVAEEQRQKDSRTQTRGTRTNQKLTNEQIDEIQKQIKQLNNQLLNAKDPKEIALIERKIDVLQGQLDSGRGHSHKMAQVQGGSVKGGGGGSLSTSDSAFGSRGSGSSGSGSSGSPTAINSDGH
jgi:hypothetical protein